MPPELAYLMAWFSELAGFRRKTPPIVTMKAIIPQHHPLVWSDIGWWKALMKVDPKPQEIRVLMQLEVRFLKAARDAAASSSGS